MGAETLFSLLFDGHPYGHPVAGRAGTLPTLTSAHAKQFFQHRYLRPTTWVGISGAYEDTQIDALQTGLERLPGNIQPDDAKLAPIPVHSRRLLAVETTTPVTGFHLGHIHDVNRNHPDWPALYLATQSLGAHRQSFGRLFEAIRTQRGLNYGNYAYMEAFKQRHWSTYPEQGTLIEIPVFYLWLRPTSIENGPFALKLAISELEKWVETGLSIEEFETTRSYLQGHLPLETQDAGQRLAQQLDALATDTPVLQDTLTTRLGELDLETVNTAIKRHIHPETLWIVAVSGEAESLKNTLSGAGATPIVYAEVTPSEEQAARDKEVAESVLGIEPDQASTIPSQGIFR